MTLDTIYKEYCDNHSDEIEHKLCERIKKLAGIVLKQFRVRPYDDDYDEFMQMAYLLFFEILPSYDPDVGRLDGYFIVYFQRELAKFLRKRGAERKDYVVYDMVPDESDLATDFIYDDLIARFNMQLTDEQRDIFSLMLEGYTDDEISGLMDVPLATVKKDVSVIQDTYNLFIKE